MLNASASNATEIGKVATSLTAQTAGDIISGVTNPVIVRVKALHEALSESAVTSLVLGGITLLIFPPAAPLVAGCAVLEAPKNYQEALKRNQSDANRAVGDRTELSDLVKLFYTQPEFVKMETNHIHVRLNTNTGESETVILSGVHTGKSLLELNSNERLSLAENAPDGDTQKIIESCIKGFSQDVH